MANDKPPADFYVDEEAPTLEHVVHPSRVVAPERARQPKALANVLTVEQLAERWSVNVKTIYGMIDREELAVLRLGRVIRIARSVVEMWESQGRVASPGE